MEIGFDIEKYLVHSKKVDYFRVAEHPTVCWDQETMHAPPQVYHFTKAKQ